MNDFIEGFCKVAFLCYAGDPNWLGWVVLVVGVVLAAICLLLVVLLITSLLSHKVAEFVGAAFLFLCFVSFVVLLIGAFS